MALCCAVIGHQYLHVSPASIKCLPVYVNQVASCSMFWLALYFYLNYTAVPALIPGQWTQLIFCISHSPHLFLWVLDSVAARVDSEWTPSHCWKLPTGNITSTVKTRSIHHFSTRIKVHIEIKTSPNAIPAYDCVSFPTDMWVPVLLESRDLHPSSVPLVSFLMYSQ